MCETLAAEPSPDNWSTRRTRLKRSAPLQFRSNSLGEGQKIAETGADDGVEDIQVEFTVLVNSKVRFPNSGAMMRSRT
jgi:hypothetical protein